MLPHRTKSWAGLGLLGVGAILCAACSAPSEKREAGAARRPGVTYELREGEKHTYRLELAPGQVVDATAEQRGIDVSLTLSNPAGGELLSIDSPTGTEGNERLVAIAEAGGTYELRVLAATGWASGGQGQYLLRLDPPRSAQPEDRTRAQACREYSEGDRLRKKGTDKDRRRALVHYDRARQLCQDLGDMEWQIVVFRRLGRLLQDLGDLPAAIATYQQALELKPPLKDSVSFLNYLAVLYAQQGDVHQALKAGEQALALAPRTGDLVSEAAALSNLGMISRSWGENDEALKYFARSLEVWKKGLPHREWATTLDNQGETLHAIGSSQQAIDPLQQALKMQKSLEDRKGEARTYRTLGVVYARLGSDVAALKYLEEARAGAQAQGDLWTEALALNNTGSIQLERGRLDEAQATFSEALRIARDGGHRDNEAFALAGLARVRLAEGDAAGASELFAHSEELYTRLGDPNALSMVLYGRALAERSRGRLEAALAFIERAVDLTESLRENVSQRDHRSHVIGARTDLYDLKVDLLLRQGDDAEAFAASEWRRARSMLEMVEKMGAVGPPRNLPRDILRRQGVLRNRLNELTGAQLRSDPQNQPEIRARIREALTRWEELSEEMRRLSPAYAAVTEPKLVGVREVQEILDPDTALIAYTLGEERSTLWWIEKDALVVRELRPRAELERLANDVYDQMAQPKRKQQERAQRQQEELGKLLLGSVADRLGNVRRLVVVADDALQILPFAALPVPGSGLLVESHAVVQLPSASLAVTLHARQPQRASPEGLLAVFAAPVFGPGELASLPHSKREAEEIRAMAPAGMSRLWIGFDAHRDNAMAPDLARFRYVHFATHGIVNLENPNLSGIQLSRVDPQGKPVEGMGILPFYEVYNLRLPADLITLSACQTAVGPQVRGEGPLGMSRSFLYAGASRVVGSLWDVDDEAAAELMILFYRALLEEGLPPSLALQKAQNEMRAQVKWQSPQHWAGFVLQGDWR